MFFLIFLLLLLFTLQYYIGFGIHQRAFRQTIQLFNCCLVTKSYLTLISYILRKYLL